MTDDGKEPFGVMRRKLYRAFFENSFYANANSVACCLLWCCGEGKCNRSIYNWRPPLGISDQAGKTIDAILADAFNTVRTVGNIWNTQTSQSNRQYWAWRLACSRRWIRPPNSVSPCQPFLQGKVPKLVEMITMAHLRPEQFKALISALKGMSTYLHW